MRGKEGCVEINSSVVNNLNVMLELHLAQLEISLFAKKKLNRAELTSNNACFFGRERNIARD